MEIIISSLLVIFLIGISVIVFGVALMPIDMYLGYPGGKIHKLIIKCTHFGAFIAVIDVLLGLIVLILDIIGKM